MRIAPLEPPYPDDAAAALERVRLPGSSEDLAFFALLARHLPLMDAVLATGQYCISKRTNLAVHDREIVVLRTCARARCTVEWGAHVAMWLDRAGLTQEQARATVLEGPDAACWTATDAALIRLADALHEEATVPDDLWAELAQHWTDEQLLDLIFVAGTYRTASYFCNAVGVEPVGWFAPYPQTEDPSGRG